MSLIPDMKYSLSQPVEYCEEIKKSRFIVKAAPVATEDEARVFLNSAREAPANHNCWAYRMGSIYRFSDDGEPSGTAGKPIFSAIERQELNNLIVVVVRYFGGIKLGAGGLIRAYGGTSARCLQQAEKQAIIAWLPIQLIVPFEDLGKVYPVITQYGVIKLSEKYLVDGVELDLAVAEPQLNQVKKSIADAGRGRLVIREK